MLFTVIHLFKILVFFVLSCFPLYFLLDKKWKKTLTVAVAVTIVLFLIDMVIPYTIYIIMQQLRTY